MRPSLAAVAFACALPVLAAPQPQDLDAGADLAYRRALKPAADERRLNADRGVTARARAVLNRIAAGAPAIDAAAQSASWQVNVVTDPAWDVVVYPGARIVLTTGLVAQAGLADEELAAIVAHAVAHALLGHDRQRIAEAATSPAATSADANRRALAIADLAAASAKRRHTPDETAAADRASVELVARGAYDPRPAAAAWRKMAAAAPAIVARYPVDDARLAALDKAAQAAVPLFEETAARAQAQQRAPPPPRVR